MSASPSPASSAVASPECDMKAATTTRAESYGGSWWRRERSRDNEKQLHATSTTGSLEWMEAHQQSRGVTDDRMPLVD